MYAGQHELEIEAAEKFCSLVPCAEMVRFSCSGSEAVHAAMRLARAVTGRTKILRFEGHYHGWFDNQFWNYAPPLDKAGPRENPNPIPATKGQSPADAEHLVIRPWNDLALVEEAFKQHPGQIAAVLTEPIMCNTGGIMPAPGFLEGLRELCTKNGALLIFDEVITGFRVSLGGAQQLFRRDARPGHVRQGHGRRVPGQRDRRQAGVHEGLRRPVGHPRGHVQLQRPVHGRDRGGDGHAGGRRRGRCSSMPTTMGRRLMEGIERGRHARPARTCTSAACRPAFFVSFNDKEEIVDYRTSPVAGRDGVHAFLAGAAGPRRARHPRRAVVRLDGPHAAGCRADAGGGRRSDEGGVNESDSCQRSAVSEY